MMVSSFKGLASTVQDSVASSDGLTMIFSLIALIVAGSEIEILLKGFFYDLL